jgi:hypothetical protein
MACFVGFESDEVQYEGRKHGFAAEFLQVERAKFSKAFAVERREKTLEHAFRATPGSRTYFEPRVPSRGESSSGVT